MLEFVFKVLRRLLTLNQERSELASTMNSPT
jgi:hypothetical protein